MALDTQKFENVHQLGGIRTGRLDEPGAGGGEGTRVALFDTGSGRRFTVALDRGADIVEELAALKVCDGPVQPIRPE